MTDHMIDLESLGLGPRAAVMEIACVSFDINLSGEGQLHQVFQADVDATSCLRYWGEIDPATVDWWKEQDCPMRSEERV